MQHRLLLATALVAVKLKKPLVIHCCCGWNVNNQCATDDCIHILQQILPKSFPVYIHCLTGGKCDYQKWLQSFHSCVFGLTGALLDPKKHHHELLSVIGSMDLGHILLESDALLLLLPKYHEFDVRNSNPLMVINIAEEIACLCHLPVNIIAKATLRNTLQFFGLALQ